MKSIKPFFSSKYQTSIDYIVALLVLLLPISKALPNLLLVPLFLLVVFHFRKYKAGNFKPFLILGLAVVWIVIRSIFETAFLQEFDFYSRIFLVFALFLLITQVRNVKLIEHFFLVGISIALLGSAIAVGIYTYQNPDYVLDIGAEVNELLWLERPYFGFMLSLAVFICLKNAEKFKKNDYYLLALIFIGFSIYISARLSIFMNLLLIFIFLLNSYQIKRGTKIWTGIIIALLIGLAFGLSDNLLSRMKISNDYEKTIHLIKDYEPRFVIWPCATEIAQTRSVMLFGMGSPQQIENELTACYAKSIDKESKRNYYLQRKFNTHNQFIDFLFLGGIVPALLLLFFFFYVWFSKSSVELKLVVFLFFCFFLVENVLHRQLGCYLLGIFAALYSRKERNEEN